MKPTEGRRRVIIEEVQPVVDAGRYPAKRVLGEPVQVTAAIFADGHDHLAARLLYRHSSERRWSIAPCQPLTNDLWQAEFTANKLGRWLFTLEAWVDHFDTWAHDLDKRLAAQHTSAQDIPLALRIGASHLLAASNRAKGADAKALKQAADDLRGQAEAKLEHYESPITPQLAALVASVPDLSLATTLQAEFPVWVERERARFSTWYELFPRSAATATPPRHGTLRDVAAKVPEIAKMGFDVLYMPPIHPIGKAYRKGRNNAVSAEAGDVGSPWAIGAKEGGHTDILPALGTFQDFASLVQTARENRMEIAMDIAFQCSPDHPWVRSHPDWFIQRPDGSIQYAENPPKKYQDIYPLNFESADWRGLWDALYNVFAFWVDHGVHIFRADNPHTKALPFWEWCIAEVQSLDPDVIFLAEAFTRPHVMYSLAKAGFTQSYTYFTWQQDRAALESYLTEITQPPVADFFRPNLWPNTPDILHAELQVADPLVRRAVFLKRVFLAATLSANYGIYGPAYELLEWRAAPPAPGREGSEEYLDSEKYQLRDWSEQREAGETIAPFISQLNHLRRAHPALQRNDTLHFHGSDNAQIMAWSKSAGADTLLMVCNLDSSNTQSAFLTLDLERLGLAPDAVYEVEDLLTGSRYIWRGARNFVALDPVGLPAHLFRITRPA